MLASTLSPQDAAHLNSPAGHDRPDEPGDATFAEWVRLRRDLHQTGEQLLQIVTRLDHLTASVKQGSGPVDKLFAVTALTDRSQKLLTRATETMGGFGGATHPPGFAVISQRSD